MNTGDRVRVRTMNPPGHNRAPSYVRGRRGVVVRSVGDGRFPDEAAAVGAAARREAIWTVAFTATELWGADAGPHDTVHVDLFETYLEVPGDGGERP